MTQWWTRSFDGRRCGELGKGKRITETNHNENDGEASLPFMRRINVDKRWCVLSLCVCVFLIASRSPLQHRIVHDGVRTPKLVDRLFYSRLGELFVGKIFSQPLVFERDLLLNQKGLQNGLIKTRKVRQKTEKILLLFPFSYTRGIKNTGRIFKKGFR